MVYQLNDAAALLSSAGKLSLLLLKLPKGCCFVIRAAVNPTVHRPQPALARNVRLRHHVRSGAGAKALARLRLADEATVNHVARTFAEWVDAPRVAIGFH